MHQPGAEREALDRLQKQLEAILEELREIRETPQEGVPAGIFSTGLTPLQAIAAYLAEHKTASEIARLTARPKSTITAALAAAKRKGGLPPRDWTGPVVPLKVFSQPSLAPTEAIVLSLSRQGLANPEIAKAIGKDARNIWHALSNAKKKTGGADLG